MGREDIKKDLTADFWKMKKDLRDDLWTSMRMDVRGDIREQKKDLRDDLTHDLKRSLENTREVLLKDLEVDLMERLKKDLKNVDKGVRDDISDVKRTNIDVQKAGDVGQKALMKVKNTKVTLDGEGTAINKCESIDSSTEVAILTVDTPVSSSDDMIHLDQENEKILPDSSFSKAYHSSFVNLTTTGTKKKIKTEKETIDGETKREEKTFDDNDAHLSSTLIHHSSNSDPAITMFGYRFRYNKKIASLEEDWEETFLDLIKYKSIHGNCDVLKGKSALWYWVNRQRNFYRLVWSKSTEYDVNNIQWLILTANRVERFNSLGFKWKLHRSNPMTTAEYKVKYNEACITRSLKWENNYSVLFEYKLKHGHSDVPHACPLGEWVNLQKRHYKIGSISPYVAPDQAERLNTLGFNWDSKTSSKWYLKFDALYSYQIRHGNTNVAQSFKDNAWVREQRLRIKKGKLTDKQKINLLNEIHFYRDEQSESLEEEKSTAQELSTWKIRFSELAEYKLKHGNCNVPDEYPLNSELELWVKHQRFLYKLGCQNNHPLFMNSRSYTKLNELGFSWSIVSNCVDKLRRYHNLLEVKHKHGDYPISKKRDHDSCNAKEKISHKKDRKEKNLKKKRKEEDLRRKSM